MEDEIKNFIKVWISVFLSLCYCYIIAGRIPKGKFRLLSLLPIFFLFLLLPLNLFSLHLGGTTAFFIAWLANFKLLLFSFGQGPLSSDPSITLLQFISIACLPIKIKQDPSPQSPLNIKNKQNPSPKNTQSPLNPSFNSTGKPSYPNGKHNPSPQITKKGPKSPLNYVIKGLLFAVLLRIYDYKDHIHPKVMLFLYCFHIYFVLEMIMAMVAYLARSLLGLELEAQFDEPYLSTSLQDFWGRRWNIMVTTILRPTVYEPIRSIAGRLLGKRMGLLVAMLVTFIVSGLIHELMFFYIGRAKPTWEITWFFVLHGVLLVLEVAMKKALAGRFQLHRAISGPLAIGFVIVTGFWLFFPQLLRCNADVRALREYTALGEFVKDVGRALRWGSFGAMSA